MVRCDTRAADSTLRPGDVLFVQASRTIPVDPTEDAVSQQFKQINGEYRVRTDGKVDLGPEYGQVFVVGLTVSEAQRAIEQQLKGILASSMVRVVLANNAAQQQIAGEPLVRPDGTVALGIYRSVYLVGASLDEAKSRIEKQLSKLEKFARNEG